MKRYAFIDVQNTSSTTQKLLGFIVDWHKLCIYLTNKWECEKVFFYSGIDEGDDKTAKEFELLANNGCVVRAKTVFAYKKPDKTLSWRCDSCNKEHIEVINMGYNRKSNCDVDLTVDAMELAGTDKEFLIFTGDGDFDYLIRNVIEKGTKVFIVSSDAGERRPGISTKRLSSKLKQLVREKRGKVNLINIDNWKFKIKKDI